MAAWAVEPAWASVLALGHEERRQGTLGGRLSQTRDAHKDAAEIPAASLVGVKYANFLDIPMDTCMSYPPETFDRLPEVKAHYDPDDLFRANHPIPCAAAAG